MGSGDIVLLVDDDPDLLDYLSLELADDVLVETATTGDEAQERLQRRPLPALVVTDLSMPGGTGGEELMRWIADAPGLANIPVILLTARDDAALRERMLQLGASDYLVKPFPASELRLRVRNLLRVSNLLADLSAARDEAERAHATVLEINAELDRFASAVAHDLQAPLANIASYASLVRDLEIDDAKRNQIMGAIADNAQRASDLVRALLAQARTLGAHGAQDEVTITSALEHVRKLLATQIDDAGADVTAHRADLRVKASALALERVLLNLVQNSVKYARPGEPPVVEVTATESSDHDGMVEVVVSDNGRGVPDELKNRVLRHGARAGGGAEEGSGIGLAAVRRVVGWYDGDIWLTDRADAQPGLEVHFTLPAAS